VIYYIPNVKTFQIVYDMADLFEIVPHGGPLSSVWKKPYYKLLRRTLSPESLSNRYFVPLSHALEQRLQRLGLPHSPVVFPPCDMIFKVGEKKRQVCLVTRIATQKNVHEFMQVAGRLPEYRFILVGAEADKDRNYSRKLLNNRPQNVDYVEVRIRERPELVEESKVYLYTSREPGVGIALGQAMGAGCIPITPVWGGGAEMVTESGVGYSYHSVKEATDQVRKALDSEETRDDAMFISERAEIFSSESFRNKIGNIVGN